MLTAYDEPLDLPSRPRATRRVRVWLPDDYWSSAERYPVTYFLDGQAALPEPGHEQLAGLRLERFLASWDKAMIAVAVEGARDARVRTGEYCPWPARVRGIDADPMGARTADWLADVVKPHVDARFRTWSHREATAMCGVSLGAMMSLYAVAARNEVFSKAGCLSPGARIWDRNLRIQVADAAHLRELSPDTRVFLSFGSRECGHKTRGDDPASRSQESRAMGRLSLALGDHGCASCVVCQRGGRHRMSDWNRLVPAMMAFLWQDRRP